LISDAPAPMSHTYFSQRLRLHYVDWGNEDAPTMVLVHGIHDHCRTFDDLASEFAASFHVIAPDLRGHGDSEWVNGSNYHYIDYIYDLHQLVHQSGLAPITLVAHSMGGAIAAMFAGVYPELVERPVIIEGIGLWSSLTEPVPTNTKIRNWVSQTRGLAARQPKRYETLEAAYQRMQQANPQLARDQAMHLTAQGANQNEDGSYSWKYDKYTYNFTVFGYNSEEMIELWRHIACPVLIINASHGLAHRIGQDDTLQYFADVQLRIVADAGHWTYHDKLAEVAANMRQFLT
jgi:pimeloyl-ACP methyl ester carboxylesterase